MNIMAQACGVAVLLVILYFVCTSKTLKLQTNIAFKIMLVVAILNMIMDVATVYVISMHENFSDLFISIVAKTYIILIISTAFCAMYYAYADIYPDKKTRRNKLLIQLIVYGLAELKIIVMPLKWEYDGEHAYLSGVSSTCAYLIGVYAFTWILYIVFSKKNLMNKRIRDAVAIWIMLWAVTAAIQYFIPTLRIVSFGEALGVFVVYCLLENPESNIDKLTGLFNQKAFEDYIRKLFIEKKKFSLYLLVFSDIAYIKDEMASEEEKKSHEDFINFLTNLKEAKVFCDADDQIKIVFDDCTKSKESRELLEYKIKKEWSQKYSIYSNMKYFYVEDGRFTSDVHSFMKLLRYARDNNRDRIKHGIIQIDSEMFEKMVQENVAEILIEKAMNENRIEVFYQPIYSTDKHRFTSAEALVRIRDEKGVIVPPAKFINVAEENGMIIRLGEIVFEKVCNFIKNNSFEELGLEYIEINLSVVQCCYRHLASDYIKIMEKYQVEPSKINLEITESASIDAKNMLLANMEKLINYGVKFSLDDFGTGQSNLNYIAEMPVDIVKFDRDMVSAYFDNNKAQYVMDAAMGMIKGMEMKIVSEGIETSQQYEKMKKLGINYIQGFYFSKPLPENEFIEFIMKSNNA